MHWYSFPAAAVSVCQTFLCWLHYVQELPMSSRYRIKLKDFIRSAECVCVCGLTWVFCCTLFADVLFRSQGASVFGRSFLVASLLHHQLHPLHPPLLPHHPSHHHLHDGQVQRHQACGVSERKAAIRHEVLSRRFKH